MALTPAEQERLAALEAKRTGVDYAPIPEVIRPVSPPEMRQQVAGMAATPLEGAMFGFGGETAGLMSMLLGRGYQAGQARFDEPRESFAERHPYIALGAEVAGGAATGGGPAATVARAPYFAARPLLTALGLGAIGAAVTGAGKAETAAEAPQAALEAAPFGAAAGALAPMILSGATRLGGAVGRGIQSLRPRPGGVGARRAGELVELDELTPTDIVSRMRSRGPESRLADVGGPNVRERAETLAVEPGRTAARAQDFLRSRQEQAIPRIESAMQRGTGQTGRYLQPYRQMQADKAARARPLYQAARSDEVSVEQMSPMLMHLDERIADLQGTPLGNQLNRIKNMLFTTTDGQRSIKTNVGRQLHAVKLEIDRGIRRALRQEGGGPLYRELKDAQDELLEVMDNSSAYAQARNLYAEDSALENAAELGRSLFRGDIERLADDVSRMSQSEQDAYMMGAARAIVEKISREGSESGAAQRLLRNPDVRQRLRTVFPDEGAYQDFVNIVETERDYARIANRIFNQSATYQRLRGGTEPPMSLYQAVDRVAKWAMQKMVSDPEQVINELGAVLWEFGPDQIEEALRRNRLSDRAIQGLMERVRGAASLAGGQAAGIGMAQE